ncbi:type I DNA topoisomerase [Bowmanella sp. JS7-9]|uniref:Type I DNA topoisomerase n=1 Tax=Pseudobowmanella zhangzhouensis TaxID=1537679 RepID=A0ABW1XP70_9ALTE|nr:topoisomerase DNA-binding C4 zinc finger domain-containing protein [Bowmanella sp. JS7-9]TBX24372.1 cytochrome C551 [Bowmanella sp. JS7-9]
MSKIDHSLFHADHHALQQAFGDCPQCAAPLQLKRSKKGPFIGCSRYPECDFSKPLHEHEDSLIKVIDGSHCPECDAPLAIKKGRYGLFIGCSRFPDCHHIESIKTQDDTQVNCPVCKNGHLVKRANKYGKSFYACNGYPACKFLMNHTPISGVCQKCGFGVLEKRGGKLRCADKRCQHVQE